MLMLGVAGIQAGHRCSTDRASCLVLNNEHAEKVDMIPACWNGFHVLYSPRLRATFCEYDELIVACVVLLSHPRQCIAKLCEDVDAW